MVSEKNSNITSETDDLLNNFFDAENEQETVKEQLPADDPINGLRVVVMSIEWEITDDILESYTREIKILMDFYKEDSIILRFLKLLESLGRYIRKKEDDAHPDSLRLLQSFFSELEKIVMSKNMTHTEKKEILSAEISKYKELKANIHKEKSKSLIKDDINTTKEPSKKAESMENAISAHKENEIDTIVSALKEMNNTIKTGFDALIAELATLKNK